MSIIGEETGVVNLLHPKSRLLLMVLSTQASVKITKTESSYTTGGREGRSRSWSRSGPAAALGERTPNATGMLAWREATKGLRELM